LLIQKRKNPTSQNENRGFEIQRMATSCLGWRIVYLNIIGILLSDKLVKGQTIYFEREYWGLHIVSPISQGRPLNPGRPLNRRLIKRRTDPEQSPAIRGYSIMGTE
jgi:hypothetical protein